MKYKGIEITPVKRPNEPYCNSCGDSGERWKVGVSLGDVGGTTVVLCTDCLQALAKMSLGIQSLYAQDGRYTDDMAKAKRDEDNSLSRETVDLIKRIYAKYPVGGALHIVLDDNNVDDESICWCMIHEIPQAPPEDLPLFEKCATNLIMLKSEQKRNECIKKATI